MRRGMIFLATLAAVGLVWTAPMPVLADSVSVGVSTESFRLGINISSKPDLVVVPGTAVSHAPALPHNYCFHGERYYVCHEGVWFSSAHYNGPWMAIHVHQVPQPILAVPVTYYKVPPGHMKKGGQPAAGHHDKEHKKKKKKWDD